MLNVYYLPMSINHTNIHKYTTDRGTTTYSVETKEESVFFFISGLLSV